MVLYGIREQTHDIDMGCSSAMADQLVADGYSYQLTESGNRKFNYGDALYQKMGFEELENDNGTVLMRMMLD